MIHKEYKVTNVKFNDNHKVLCDWGKKTLQLPVESEDVKADLRNMKSGTFTDLETGESYNAEEVLIISGCILINRDIPDDIVEDFIKWEDVKSLSEIMMYFEGYKEYAKLLYKDSDLSEEELEQIGKDKLKYFAHYITEDGKYIYFTL